MAKNNIKQEKFAAHYAEYGNATRAYLYVNPKATYGTARTEGSEWLTKPNIIDLIQQKKDEFNEKFMHSKEKTIQELLLTAEEAKEAGNYNAYGKLREMIIKMNGFYEADKVELSGGYTINISVTNGNEEDINKI